MARDSRVALQSSTIGAAALLALAGCATARAPVSPAPAPAPVQVVRTPIEPPGTAPAAKTPPPPVSPFIDSPVSFLIHGHFTRGELVIVRVCLRPDHSIASSDVIESSGDRLFDQMAVTWAQRVRQRESAPAGRLVSSCGAVRVELHDATQPSVIGDHTDQLG